MEYVVAFTVLAAALWIVCVKLPPRRAAAWLIIAWAAAIFAPMAVALTRGDAYAAADAGVLVAMFGVPGLCLLSVVWLTIRPTHLCPMCGPLARRQVTECETCGLDIVDSGPVVPPRSSVGGD
jgi:hypothetical protein